MVAFLRRQHSLYFSSIRLQSAYSHQCSLPSCRGLNKQLALITRRNMSYTTFHSKRFRGEGSRFTPTTNEPGNIQPRTMKVNASTCIKPVVLGFKTSWLGPLQSDVSPGIPGLHLSSLVLWYLQTITLKRFLRHWSNRLGNEHLNNTHTLDFLLPPNRAETDTQTHHLAFLVTPSYWCRKTDTTCIRPAKSNIEVSVSCDILLHRKHMWSPLSCQILALAFFARFFSDSVEGGSDMLVNWNIPTVVKFKLS